LSVDRRGNQQGRDGSEARAHVKGYPKIIGPSSHHI
jgi:hypothetical protein